MLHWFRSYQTPAQDVQTPARWYLVAVGMSKEIFEVLHLTWDQQAPCKSRCQPQKNGLMRMCTVLGASRGTEGLKRVCIKKWLNISEWWALHVWCTFRQGCVCQISLHQVVQGRAGQGRAGQSHVVTEHTWRKWHPAICSQNITSESPTMVGQVTYWVSDEQAATRRDWQASDMAGGHVLFFCFRQQRLLVIVHHPESLSTMWHIPQVCRDNIPLTGWGLAIRPQNKICMELARKCSVALKLAGWSCTEASEQGLQGTCQRDIAKPTLATQHQIYQYCKIIC